jgi:uncharacterized UBP type Zn finger protein
MTDEQ